MACFADINVSQGIVATYRYARYGGIFNIHLTANLLRNLGKFFNRLRFDRSMVMSCLWPRFCGPPCIYWWRQTRTERHTDKQREMGRPTGCNTGRDIGLAV